MGRGYLGIEERSGRDKAVKRHYLVLRGTRGMLAVFIAVRKQSERFADILFVCLQRHFVLRGCQAFKAPDLLIVRDASRHFFGSRAAAGRIDEAIKHIKADLADQGDGLVKFLLRFAGEAADYICRESCIGDFFL